MYSKANRSQPAERAQRVELLCRCVAMPVLACRCFAVSLRCYVIGCYVIAGVCLCFAMCVLCYVFALLRLCLAISLLSLVLASLSLWLAMSLLICLFTLSLLGLCGMSRP